MPLVVVAGGFEVFVSPHHYYPTDHGWLFGGTVEKMMHEIGMSANLCLEGHLRELIEQGFAVSAVKDATAAAVHPELGDGSRAAMTNFGFLTESVITTSDAIETLRPAHAAAGL